MLEEREGTVGRLIESFAAYVRSSQRRRDLPGAASLSGCFVKRILDGANPGDMPAEQPTRLQLSVNAKTAAVLGISIPDALLGRADKVIE
jgi:hypothetical protein